MNAVAVFCALLLLCAAGFGIALPLLAGRGRIALAELGALTWLLGTAVVSMLVWIGGQFLPPWGNIALVSMCSLALFARAVSLLRKGVAVTWPEFRAWKKRDLALFGVLVAQLAVIGWMGWHKAMGWDGLFAWEWKARLAFLNDGRLPAYYFANADWHADYPLYLPMNELWLYFWIGEPHQFWVRIFFTPFYIVAMLLLYHGCMRLSGNRTVALATACLPFFLPEALTGPGGFSSGYVDFPMAVFYLAAVSQLLFFLREKSRGALVIFAVLAGALPWIKHEGLILWGCLMLAGTAVLVHHKQLRALPWVALPGIVVGGVWTVFLKFAHPATGHDFLPMTLEVFQKNVGRLQPIFFRILHEPTNFERWSFLWVGFSVALIYLAVTKRGKIAALCLMLTALPVGIDCTIYIFSAWTDYTRHVDSSLARLILQVTLVALLTCGLAMTRGERDTKPD